MLFQRFEVVGLAHYSYAVGCSAAGELAIVDPERVVDGYLAYAEAHHVRITHVLETHVHADYASGARALAARTGATLHVSGHDAGDTYEVTHPHADLLDGDGVQVGAVRLEARHTPGHTPEHLALLVYDGARSAGTPMAMLSGDFLLVGSLGRPDLLGDDETQALASRLHASVRRLADLPDGLEIHPAHGAGSMCGAGMAGRPTSTLGYERATNPFLEPRLSRARFVERLLATLPPFPPYYRRMKRLNADGPPLPADPPGGTPLDVERFRRLADAGHVVVDLRSPVGFSGGHVHGALSVGIDPSLPVWAAWVVPYETPLLLVADHDADVAAAARAFARVGLDDLVGVLEGGMDAWRTAGHPLRQTALMTPEQVHDLMVTECHLRILDVRGDEEWRDGHIPAPLHVPVGGLADRLDEVPGGDGPLAVICGSGYRSTVAASILERNGLGPVINVVGGMRAWQQAGLPIMPERHDPARPVAP